MPEVHSILTVASRGSKLSLDLYAFAAAVPSATNDASDLAKLVVDLSRSLWHVGASQKDDRRITTRAAREALFDLVQQCEGVLNDIEAAVPLEMTRDGRALTFGIKWEWNTSSKARIQYLLGHLKALCLTLDVMAQAIRSVKVIEWSFMQEPNPMSAAAVDMERMQLESLVVEQQLAHLKALQMFQTIRIEHANAQLALLPHEHPESSMTLFEDNETNPGALVTYQEPTLANTQAQNDTERLALVRKVSPNYVEEILNRWTKLREIRKMQQPSIASDDSADDDFLSPVPSHSSGAHGGPMGPILTHIKEEYDMHTTAQRDVGSPIPVPERTRRPYGPASPTTAQNPQFQHANSWSSRSSAYVPAPAVKPPTSAGSTPRVSFSNQGGQTPGMTPTPKATTPFAPPLRTTAPAVSSPLSTPVQGHMQTPFRPNFTWRLRLADKYWDYENDKVVQSNANLDPAQVQEDRYVSTEILARFVTQEALQDLRYNFDRAQVDMGDGRITKLETLFCIRRALKYHEVEAIVTRTQQRFEQRFKRSRPTPQLDRTISAPLPGPGSYLRAPQDSHRSSTRNGSSRRQRSPRSSVSNDDTDTDGDHADKRRIRRSGSTSSARSGTALSSKSETSNKTRKTAGAVRNVAGVAGFAALLEGVVEGLSAM